MARTNRTVEERLTSYAISRKRYKHESNRLLTVGFTQTQADKIILRPSSKVTVAFILKTCSTLLENYQFIHEQIMQMAANNGGSQALRAVIDCFSDLKKHEFLHTEIVEMASNNGGGKTLRTVLKYFAKLKRCGFDRAQIVKIASQIGCSKTLETMIASFARLKMHGFSTTQIGAIAAKRGGALAIKILLEYYQQLRELDLENEEIAVFASMSNASRVLLNILEAPHKQPKRLGTCTINETSRPQRDRSNKLRALNFDSEQISALNFINQSTDVTWIVNTAHAQLKSLSMSNQQIIDIISNGGVQALSAVIQHYKELCSHGYSHEQIVSLAACPEGHGAKRIADTIKNEFLHFINEHLLPVLATENTETHAAEPASLQIVTPEPQNCLMSLDTATESQPSSESSDYSDSSDSEEGYSYSIDFEKPQIQTVAALKNHGHFGTYSRKRCLDDDQAESATKYPRQNSVPTVL